MCLILQHSTLRSTVVSATLCFPGSSRVPLPSQKVEFGCSAGDQVRSLGGEDPLEKERAAHFSILAWGSPWTEKPGGLQSMGTRKSWPHLSN